MVNLSTDVLDVDVTCFNTFTTPDGHTAYVLPSTMDFHHIPEDKIDDCLKDFKVFIAQARAVSKIIDLKKMRFIWIDDGSYGDSAKIKLYTNKG